MLLYTYFLQYLICCFKIYICELDSDTFTISVSLYIDMYSNIMLYCTQAVTASAVTARARRARTR